MQCAVCQKTIQTVLAAGDMKVEDVDHFIFHQANKRILEAAAKHLKIPAEKMPMNMDHCGNLSAASIPVLLDEYNQAGKIKPGDKIILAAFGGGKLGQRPSGMVKSAAGALQIKNQKRKRRTEQC